MVDLLLDDLTRFSSDTVEVCLTLNVPEKKFQVPENGVRLRIRQNTHPKGFAANHNAAAQSATTPYFCVLNPDVRLTSHPFPRLVQQLNAHSAGAIAPLIVDSQGRPQDSVRRFPTLGSLVRKAL